MHKNKCKNKYNICCLEKPPQTAYLVNLCNKIGQITLSSTNSTQGGNIYITYTITNTGTASIHPPIYVVDELTGKHMIVCQKFKPGQSVTVTYKNKFEVTKPFYMANAYTTIVEDCLILISNPILIYP